VRARDELEAVVVVELLGDVLVRVRVRVRVRVSG